MNTAKTEAEIDALDLCLAKDEQKLALMRTLTGGRPFTHDITTVALDAARVVVATGDVKEIAKLREKMAELLGPAPLTDYERAVGRLHRKGQVTES